MMDSTLAKLETLKTELEKQHQKMIEEGRKAVSLAPEEARSPGPLIEWCPH